MLYFCYPLHKLQTHEEDFYTPISYLYNGLICPGKNKPGIWRRR